MTYQAPQIPSGDLRGFLQEELDRIAASLQPPGFIFPALQNSWTSFSGNFPTARFYKDGLDRVHLSGVIANGTATSGTVLFVLPESYRPSLRLVFVTISNNALGRVDVFANGDVRIVRGSSAWLSLEGISFAAEQ